MGGPRLRMCRGCCCGTPRKHPDVDHGAIADVLGDCGPRARAQTVDCLWACDRSNVVVVNPSPAARRTGQRPVWIRSVNDLGTAGILAAWVRAGGPGVVPLPPDLAALVSAPGLRGGRPVGGPAAPPAAP